MFSRPNRMELKPNGATPVKKTFLKRGASKAREESKATNAKVVVQKQKSENQIQPRIKSDKIVATKQEEEVKDESFKPVIKTKEQLKKEAMANHNRTECTAVSNDEIDAQCPVCLVLMFDPTRLACGHVFCQ